MQIDKLILERREYPMLGVRTETLTSLLNVADRYADVLDGGKPGEHDTPDKIRSFIQMVLDTL